MSNEIKTLGDELPKEQARVRETINYTFECPTKEIESALDKVQIRFAELVKKRPIEEGDTLRIIRACRDFAESLYTYAWDQEEHEISSPR